MSAVIGPNPSSSALHNDDIKPELLQKIEGQGSRVTSVHLLDKEDGVLTISDDRSVRIWLRRDTGQYWPSIVYYLSSTPICFYFDESSNDLVVGLLNGSISLMNITDDYNAINKKICLQLHVNVVTGIAMSKKTQLVYSCSKDKTVVWSKIDTLQRCGSYIVSAQATSLQYDDDFVFIGDSNATITILRILGESAQLISHLKGHSYPITALAWDVSRQQLFSASTDKLIIVWDIGGKRGQCYELNGHDNRITTLSYVNCSNKLLSTDCNGGFVCWDMAAKRMMTPEWRNSDKCDLCDVPFLWNVKVMWDRKIVGVRRHHCRTCGISVCGDCCNSTTTFPVMGFEKPTRICKTCNNRMKQFPEQYDLTPLAVSNDLKYGIISMHIHEGKKKMVTVGYDRVIMIWDISSLI
ncbi:FYVE zinc finger domain and WD40 repeat and Zinc finger, FYVE/PHD-type domain and Zinc finger,RING/FYVE/PHD-type domain and WD40/YVTN repeat-like-containing domain and Zinc finger,FYVE-related domain and WD40-repeat-containing domain-containing protein [Strongyloides ratti]|uniref:FYVE-type domain-containing protein n=1 Tax=Strongyloides ratti TaxID=34506 RepID=A0A090MND6_STRRB|nr:FYVE zinc finger domain and WD40 repeat and Zinc finger, FYVE/PHD-type domain and Zinc finger,RING/FYVE/PHD-type domain and WD40/YVTN repeat-like-containing domain and Zinc finger,FYVE-related domain and WD40-repeat-containing domain-containing protein [Strongyloides ratti]CEF59586.1 FYVE zinc finger domain and WD40 repeat and Zinc finger, FYVE/PHD-type domain and Zinc finger,RING/FYVE/PHD-type domain and WD40/YVTN repeat-like-containing domain and Zinc finger,FYVE-related domain and WD40-repea